MLDITDLAQLKQLTVAKSLSKVEGYGDILTIHKALVGLRNADLEHNQPKSVDILILKLKLPRKRNDIPCIEWRGNWPEEACLLHLGRDCTSCPERN